MSEELFTSPRQIARLARASKGFAGKVLNFIQSSIERLSKGNLTAEQKSVQTFLQRAESLYAKAMAKSNPTKTKAAVQSDSGDEKASKVKFSLNGKELEYYRNKSFTEQIEMYDNGMLPSNTVLLLGSPSMILKEHGIENFPITINPKTIEKIKEKHNINTETLKKIPEALNSPNYILQSRTRKDRQSNAISQTDYDEQIKQLGTAMKALEQEKETMSKDTSDYLKATMWLKDFNEHIKEGNILTDGDQYIMKKLIKEIVVEGRKTVNFIFKWGIEKRITL